MVDFNKFLEIDIRAGTIINVQEFPEARKPAFKLEIDFGQLELLDSSVGGLRVYVTLPI